MNEPFGASNHRRVQEFLLMDSNLSHAQVTRCNVVEDNENRDVFAVRVPPYGRQKEPIYLVVYLNKTPYDFEEVTFDEWPPRTARDLTRNILGI